MQDTFQSLKLALLNTGYDCLDNTWQFHNVISTFARLYLITKGEAFIYLRDTKIKLRPGYMYLIPSYTYASYTCDNYHEQYYVHFTEEFGLGMSIYNLTDFNYEIKSTAMDEACFKRLLELHPKRNFSNNNPEYYENPFILSEFKNHNLNSNASKALETHGILKLVFSKFMNTNSKPKQKKQILLQGVFNYILKHLHEELSVTGLASSCHTSTDHFSKTFKQQFGLSPSLFIKMRRIERAQTLLITTQFPLGEIAKKVGFKNAPYFSRSFKEVTGMTPIAFKKANATS
ncbi:AraC family transcriptional regulator [Tamlana sp. 2_MG-2023]|uniref:helix-turn-helix domain-containing protein n=1 Tax=unclassified Tamlana TaxID=2614803 RepID=UPI0026E2FA0C|nr:MULTISPECIES: AraC family transcriptional regulator [unclassified Tamlana]MDO6761280.1 AraC family transcriptional regulator [Tamlana sp. 2_MG-2023]MDO6791763.1 AraC family transcriptional regulator [Tamlana sp. 1_MG-2023]